MIRVDFFIPGVDVFTGFSMCSAPSKLVQHGVLELAIQVTDYPPTLWVHEKVLNMVYKWYFVIFQFNDCRILILYDCKLRVLLFEVKR